MLATVAKWILSDSRADIRYTHFSAHLPPPSHRRPNVFLVSVFARVHTLTHLHVRNDLLEQAAQGPGFSLHRHFHVTKTLRAPNYLFALDKPLASSAVSPQMSRVHVRACVGETGECGICNVCPATRSAFAVKLYTDVRPRETDTRPKQTDVH